MKSFESFPTEKELERMGYEARVQKLKGLIGNFAEKYRRGSEKLPKLPIDMSGRIMMESFKAVYNPDEVDNDMRYVTKRQADWRREKGEEAWAEDTERGSEIGEQFEFLKTAIFNKYLGDRFAVVRSSYYDDYKNGVDNVMIDIENGNVVCAFDEVGDNASFKRQKEERILEKNLEGGAALKYGLKLEDGKLKPDRLSNLPIFCLSLSEDRVKEGIVNMEFSRDKKSPIEDEMFGTFKDELMEQIGVLESRVPEAVTKANGDKVADLERLSGHLLTFKDSVFASEIQSEQSQGE